MKPDNARIIRMRRIGRLLGIGRATKEYRIRKKIAKLATQQHRPAQVKEAINTLCAESRGLHELFDQMLKVQNAKEVEEMSSLESAVSVKYVGIEDFASDLQKRLKQAKANYERNKFKQTNVSAYDLGYFNALHTIHREFMRYKVQELEAEIREGPDEPWPEAKYMRW